MLSKDRIRFLPVKMLRTGALWPALLLIVAFAGVLLRVQRLADPASRAVSGYYSLAVNLRNTGVFAYPGSPRTPTAYRAPLYPAFLYPFAGESGADFRTAALAQVMLFLAALLLVWTIALKIGGSGAGGTAAALIYAVHPVSVMYGVSFGVEFFYGVLLAAIAAALVHASETGRTRHYALAFLLSGISITCKSPMFLFPVFLCGALLFLKDRRPSAKKLLLLCLIAYLPLLPWTVRNLERFRAFVPLEKDSAICDLYTAAAGMPRSCPPETAKAVYSASGGGELYSGKVTVLSLEAAILASPGRYLRGTIKRAPAVFSAFPLLFLFSAAGWFLFRKNAGAGLTAALAAYFVGIHLLVSFEERYLVPALPLLAVLASLPVSALSNRFSGKPAPEARSPVLAPALYGAAAMIAAVYALSLWLLAAESLEKRSFEKRPDMTETLSPVLTGPSSGEYAEYCNQKGVLLALSGRYKEAVPEFKKAIFADAAYTDPYLSLASLGSVLHQPAEELEICGMAEKRLASVPFPRIEKDETSLALLDCEARAYRELNMPARAERAKKEKKDLVARILESAAGGRRAVVRP
jgi:4-amino-4-deoxy-L-arabinose transferase-like glycosyltransferase